MTTSDPQTVTTEVELELHERVRLVTPEGVVVVVVELVGWGSGGRCRGSRVKVGIDAPRSVPVVRAELVGRARSPE